MSLQVPSKNCLPIPLREWLIIGIIYVFVIGFHGYRFGDEDMTETLSYALYLNDHSLYPNDLYIQAVGETSFNERYPFTLLLKIFGSKVEFASFVLHLVSSFLLIAGLWTLGRMFLRDNFLRLLLVLSTLVLTYYLNLGGNEIWYNYFVPSQLAKSVAVWGLICWIREQRLAGYILVALATFAQPVVGSQLALLFVLVDIREMGIKNFKGWIKGPLLYFLTAGLWVGAVFINNLISDHTVDGATFYQIMETRLAHHFFPSYYPLRSWLLLLPLMLTGAFIWRKSSTRIYYLFLWGFAGMIIYFLGIEILEIPSLLSVQWYKTTVWFKPLAILAVLLLIDQTVSTWSVRFLTPLLTIMLIISILQITQTVHWLGKKPYHFPGTSYYTAEMDLALQMKDKLPKNACILIPPQVTGVRYFSERSLFIDYKSNIHSKAYMSEAALRRRDLYGLTLPMRTSGKDMMSEMQQYYSNLETSDFQSFKEMGASHVMTAKDHPLELEKVVSNSFFTLYKL